MAKVMTVAQKGVKSSHCNSDENKWRRVRRALSTRVYKEPVITELLEDDVSEGGERGEGRGGRREEKDVRQDGSSPRGQLAKRKWD